MNTINKPGNTYTTVEKAIEEMKAEEGSSFSLKKVNLDELEHHTGLKAQAMPHEREWLC